MKQSEVCRKLAFAKNNQPHTEYFLELIQDAAKKGDMVVTISVPRSCEKEVLAFLDTEGFFYKHTVSFGFENNYLVTWFEDGF